MNTQIKLICIGWGEYEEVIQKMIGERQPFDICYTSTWVNNYYNNVDKEAFIPLDDLWDNYAPKTKSLFGKNILEATKVNGVGYGVPTYRGYASQWGFLLRKDLVERYKINTSLIKEIDDIELLLKMIKQKNPDICPLIVEKDNYIDFKSLNFGLIEDIEGSFSCPGVIDINSTEMKVFNELETPETYCYFRTLNRLYRSGYLYEHNQDTKDKEWFAKLTYINAHSIDSMRYNKKKDYIIVPIRETIIQGRDITFHMQAISSTSKNPERALMFLELINTDSYLNNLLNYGIEGVHYKKKSGDTIQTTIDSPKYSPDSTWMLANQFLSYIGEREDVQKWEKHKKFDIGAAKPKSVGFVFDARLVQSEIEQCKKIWNDYIPMLETGKADPDIYLKEMIGKLKEAGVDKIIAEKQRQLDAWSAKK